MMVKGMEYSYFTAEIEISQNRKFSDKTLLTQGRELRKHTAQFNHIITSSSREKQSTINTFFKPIYCIFFERKVQYVYLVFLS